MVVVGGGSWWWQLVKGGVCCDREDALYGQDKDERVVEHGGKDIP